MPILAYLSNLGMGGGVAVDPVVDPVVATPSGAGGKRYKWGAPYIPRNATKAVKKILEQEVRLELKVEQVQKQIAVKWVAIDQTQDLAKLVKMRAQVVEYNQRLSDLLAQLDELKKTYEEMMEEEAALAYLAYRTLH